MGLSNNLSCEAGSFSCCHLNPHGLFQSEVEALFPRAGALGCVVCVAPQLLLHTNVGPPGLPASALPGPPAVALTRVLSTQLPVSAPPTSLGECGFFISLVVGLPYSLIFCQFWLFFVFKLSFLWLCEEAQCVYLRLHLGRKSGFSRVFYI